MSKVNYETIMIAPLESQSINVKSNNANNWHLTIIDDHGNYISDKSLIAGAAYVENDPTCISNRSVIARH